MQDIADHRTLGRSHNANNFRQIRQCLLAFGREKPFGLKSLFALFKHRHQCARTGDGNPLRVQSKLGLHPRGGHFPLNDDFHPLFGHNRQTGNLPLPCHTRKDRLFVLKVKVKVSRARAHNATNFALHTDPAKFAFDQFANRSSNLADGEFRSIIARRRILKKVH